MNSLRSALTAVLAGQNPWLSGRRMTMKSFRGHGGLRTITRTMPRQMIAVGTQVALCPPHRSERARLRHSAPTLGD